jgi:alpha-glucosidase
MQRNVRDQGADPASVLSFYRALIRLRSTNTALQQGRYRTLRSHPDVFAYVRQSSTQDLVIALNMAADQREAALDGIGGSTWRVLLSSRRDNVEQIDATRLRLNAFEALLMERVLDV